MISIFKKKSSVVELYAPVNGKTVLLENVPDTVFASKMMGEGIGFSLEDKVPHVVGQLHLYQLVYMLLELEQRMVQMY